MSEFRDLSLFGSLPDFMNGRLSYDQLMAAIQYAVGQQPADWQERIGAPGSVATVRNPDADGWFVRQRSMQPTDRPTGCDQIEDSAT